MARRIKGKTVIQGFLLSFWVPSEDLLNITVDVTDFPRPLEQELINVLNDTLTSIDKKHAKRKIRGRSIRARYTRLAASTERGKPERRRVMRFSPYPSAFANRLRALRRDWYIALKKHTVILSQSGTYGASYTRSNVYLLPFDKAPGFMTVRKTKNAEIAKLEKALKAYEGTRDWKRVMTLIKTKVGAQIISREKAKLHPVHLDLNQMNIDPKVFEQYVEERGKQFIAQLNKEQRQGLEETRQQILRTRNSMVQKAVQDMQSRLSDVMRKLAHATKVKVNKKRALEIKGSIEDIKSLAESAGVDNYVGHLAETSLKLIEAISTNKKSAIREAAEALAEESGVQVKRDTSKTIAEAADALTFELSARARALFEQID